MTVETGLQRSEGRWVRRHRLAPARLAFGPDRPGQGSCLRAASRCRRHFSPIALVRDQDRAEICVVRSRLGSELATATAAAGATLLRGLMEEDDAPPGPRRRTLAAGETLTLTLTAKAGDQAPPHRPGPPDRRGPLAQLSRRSPPPARPSEVPPWPSPPLAETTGPWPVINR